MNEQLREILSKAARDPASLPDLTLTYRRGHEMSGAVHFEMRAGGGYTLVSTGRGGRSPAEVTGELDTRQVAEILMLAEETLLLDVPSSTRNIGDDELPLLVELQFDDLSHRLVIWARDARENADFTRFETALRSLLDELSKTGP